MTIHWFHLLPVFFWLMVAIVVSRPFAVILARRERQRTDAEKVLAKLPILASRSVEDWQDTLYACMLGHPPWSSASPCGRCLAGAHDAVVGCDGAGDAVHGSFDDRGLRARWSVSFLNCFSVGTSFTR